MRQERILPGSKIVPERIRENRQPFYEALRAADRAWENGPFRREPVGHVTLLSAQCATDQTP